MNIQALTRRIILTRVNVSRVYANDLTNNCRCIIGRFSMSQAMIVVLIFSAE